MEKRSHDDVSDGGRDPKRRRGSVGEASILSGRLGNDDTTEPNSPIESEIPTVPNTPTRSLASTGHAGRTSNPEANLNRLVEELRAKIFSYLPDPENLDTTLNNAASWIATSRALKDTALSRLDDGVIKQVFAAQDMRSEYFRAFPCEQRDIDYAKVLLTALEINTAAAPLMDEGSRRALVRDAVGYGSRGSGYTDPLDVYLDVYHVFDNIAANLDNFIGPDRVKVVNRVCDIHEASQRYGGVMEKLIDKSDHLEPKERLTIVNTVCVNLIDIDQTNLLAAWAPKMHLLRDDDQEAIFEKALKNPGDRPELLVHFAEHAGQMCPSVQDGIISSVLSMEPQERLRSKMLCHLARQLASFDPSRCSDIIEAVVANVQHAETEEFYPEGDCYDEPNFCAREALIHLQEHRSSLTSVDRERIAAAIDAVMATSGPAGRIQFLSKMSPAERTIAVGQACDEASKRGEFASMPALGARVSVLTKEETARFVATLVKLTIFDRRICDTIDHIVRNELKHLNADQRSDMVSQRLNIIKMDDVWDAASGLAGIRRNARILLERDIVAVRKTARLVVSLSADEVRENFEAKISLRSCHREAIRSLWEWAGHAVLNPRPRVIATGR